MSIPLIRKVASAPQHPEMGGQEWRIEDRAGLVLVRAPGGALTWEQMEWSARLRLSLEEVCGVRFS